jgi:hypothetical protein
VLTPLAVDPSPASEQKPDRDVAIDAQTHFLEQALKKKRPDVDAKPLVVKTNAPVKEAKPLLERLGQPA